MLGGPSALEQPSTSWGSTGAQQTNQTLPESPAVGSIPHCNHPSTSYPQAAVTPAANDKVPADPRKIPYRVILSKDPQPGPILSQQPHGSNNGNKDNTNEADHCSLPSTSFAETPRQSSSASSEEPAGDMTSSTTSPYRRIQFTIKIPMKKAQRLKRIASFQPQTLRKIGVSRLKLKNEEPMTIADPPPLPPPQAPPPRPEAAPRTEAELRLESRPQPPPGTFAPHPGVPPEGAPPMPMPPRPVQLNNNSPLLVNLLSNQPQGREGVSVNGPPSGHPGVQRSFSPYQYPQQTPHPVGTPGTMDPQQLAVMQQHQERQRMMMQQQQHQAMQAQHAAAMQAQNAGHPPPGTPGCMPQQQPFFNPTHQQVRQQVPVNYPPAPGQHVPPQTMYPPQPQPRMAPPQYPAAAPQMAPTPQFMARPQEPQEPAQPANKKKRKPTKRQQQKEAEMAAAAHQQAAQQQFMAQQGMMQQQHMQHPGMPMMAQNFPQGYPPQYGYPPGATPQQQQQQQQMWQMQQQRMMYHQQQQQAQGVQWHQRPPVPYPPGTPMEGPGSVHPVSQRPSSEFGTDTTSPMTPHTSFNQQQPGMVNGAFMRHDSHGNLFNFGQPAQQQPSTDPVDQLWAKDDSCADLDDLDNIDIKPMGDLGNLNPSDLLDETPTSTTSLDKQSIAPSTPNGDRIDSSIASVVEMVSKSNTQPTMTNVSQATAMSGSDFRQQGSFPNGPPFGLQQPIQPGSEPQGGRQQPPPAKMPKLEQNGTLANGHHQLPNGATKRSATSNDDDEQIGQYVKSLMVAEERKKAAESGTKAKTQRKSRKKADAVKEELEEGSWNRPAAAAAHFPGLARNQQQLIKQQGQQKQ